MGRVGRGLSAPNIWTENTPGGLTCTPVCTVGAAQAAEPGARHWGSRDNPSQMLGINCLRITYKIQLNPLSHLEVIPASADSPR